MSETHEHPDLTTTRPRQANLGGRDYWRSLDELANTEQFQHYLHREFPEAASEWHDPISRRNFLTLMGASLALAGVTGCTGQPEEKLVPYVKQPEEIVPGKPLYYATAHSFRGYGMGVLVETHMGRPTKIEGNPEHPASLGATSAQTQASILDLYDPDRAQVVRYAGQVSTWSAFINAIRKETAARRNDGGAGLRVLTQTITSPTLIKQIQQLLATFPEAKWHQYEPMARNNERAGALTALGQDVNTIHRFDKADVVVSFDADFFSLSPASVRYARDFIDRRRVRRQAGETATMNRLYVVESTPSITGAMADNRTRRIKASEIESAARALHTALTGGQADEWTTALAADLLAHKGRGIVIVGENQPPAVHALAAAMNSLLGNFGQTVVHTDPIESHPVDHLESLRELVADMQGRKVSTLLILGGNPVYDAPADLKFKEFLGNIPLRIHLSHYYDETGFECHWHIPESHWLESWGDIRAYDGTITIQQPLILPLYQTKSAHELLATFEGDEDATSYSIVQTHWKQNYTGTDFDEFWQTSLHEGFVADSAAPLKNVALLDSFDPSSQSSTFSSTAGIEVMFRPDPNIFDGRFANNGWLQELPKPITKLTWDNAALVSARTAADRGWENQQLIRLKNGADEIEIPVWIVPGHPDNAITVNLGYGRSRSGRVGTKTATSGGSNAFVLRTSAAMSFASNIEITSLGTRYPLACTQEHQLMEGRDLVRVHSIEEFKTIEKKTPHHLSLYEEFNYTDAYPNQHSWGMSIDMTACVGCNACVVACQAENNIPVVGKTEVVRGREMHWIRIDTYFSGESDDPDGPYFQPMMCQHCEKAPCEVVCPVAATTHSAEGLNEMTYNRCIGTRYCSNNCPYKVRRFNFFQYVDESIESLKLQRNPDVTVRTRGVMEKCTFCVQRINHTRIEMKNLRVQAAVAETDAERIELTKKANSLLGQLESACQQACPTQAIIFGDLNQRKNTGTPSAVELAKAQPHDYGLLTELNTNPRATYLARVENPNPALKRPEAPVEAHRSGH